MQLIARLDYAQTLLDKLREYDDQLGPHYKDLHRSKYGALGEIKSLFLANIGDHEKLQLSKRQAHPALQLLTDVVPFINKKIDDIIVCYYAYMPPGAKIYPHTDNGSYYKCVNRYQIFFDLTDEQIIEQEGSCRISNSLILFDPSKQHAFVNRSSSNPWRFVVFDILK